MGLFDTQFRVLQRFPEGYNHPTEYRYRVQERILWWWATVTRTTLATHRVFQTRNGAEVLSAQSDNLDVANEMLDALVASIRRRREDEQVLTSFKKKVVRYERV